MVREFGIYSMAREDIEDGRQGKILDNLHFKEIMPLTPKNFPRIILPILSPFVKSLKEVRVTVQKVSGVSR